MSNQDFTSAGMPLTPSTIAADNAIDNENGGKGFSDQAPAGYRSLVYVFNGDKDSGENLAYTLEIYNHEVLAFHHLEELRSAIVIRRPQAVVVDIDSEEGLAVKRALGARVTFTFPVIYTSTEDNFSARLTAIREGAEGYFVKPLDVEALSIRIDERIAKNEVHAYRVLIVDDDEHLAAYYEAILSSAGMHTKVVNDPSTVLDIMKKFKPELILVDIYMPVCTGVELSKLIRLNNQYLDIPIVFLSRETNIENQFSAIETGADDFLTKPIEPENLIHAVSYRAERYRALRKQRHQ